MLRAPSHPAHGSPPTRAAARRVTLAGALALAGAATLAGCGAPPELTRPSGAPVPSPSVTATPNSPTAPTTAPVSVTPSTPGFGEYTAVDCAGRPSGSQVIGFLRRTTRLLPSGARVTVATGPLCAGTWQYTVLQVPEQEPLQVVTNGPPGALKVVTTGTDVCNVTVRATAPAGIRTIACDGGVGAVPGL